LPQQAHDLPHDAPAPAAPPQLIDVRAIYPIDHNERHCMTMTPCFDRSYFAMRLERNRQLAAQSRNPAIRDLHLEYVRLYEQLMEQPQPA
jgi:hypothetical protein